MITTPQYIFDRCVEHLYAQGRAARIGDFCRYRGPDGRKCAAGAFIRDDRYEPFMEKKSIHEVVDKFGPGVFDCDITAAHMDLLADLQLAHDNSDPNSYGWAPGTEGREALNGYLRRTAARYCLNAGKVTP